MNKSGFDGKFFASVLAQPGQLAILTYSTGLQRLSVAFAERLEGRRVSCIEKR